MRLWRIVSHAGTTTGVYVAKSRGNVIRKRPNWSKINGVSRCSLAKASDRATVMPGSAGRESGVPRILVNCHCPEVCGGWSSKLGSSNAALTFCKPQVRETGRQPIANVRSRAARYPLLEAGSDRSSKSRSNVRVRWAENQTNSRYALVARQDGHRGSRLAFVGEKSSSRMAAGDS